MKLPLLLLALVGIGQYVEGLDNGLALTPPMGWLSWERFRCNTDCTNDPDNCISERLFKLMTDLMVKEGYKDAGYEFVIMDDCWLDKTRDPDTMRLRPDPDRFPNGIKALADYVHSKGLKLGIYEDFGTHTCAGFPGSEYYLQLDAQTFADWGVDYLKFDGCNSYPEGYKDEYPPMDKWLARTGKDIVFSTEYPLYQGHGNNINYTRLAENCNLARNNYDIQDSWDSMFGVIEFYGSDLGGFAEVAGPGFWNDPDELIIGNFGLSYDQERVHMAMWSIMASPLIMSMDPRNIRNSSKALLQNKGAIAINQDKLGKQGKRVLKDGNIQVWTKPILPKGSIAFAFINSGTSTPTLVSHTPAELGLNEGSYTITEVFEGTMMGNYKQSDNFKVYVNPTGVFFGKAVPNKNQDREVEFHLMEQLLQKPGRL